MRSLADHIYEDCLATFGRESPERRKRRFDLTPVHNVLFGLTYMCVSEIFVIHGGNVIRGPPYILIKPLCNINARSNIFHVPSINTWNSVSANVRQFTIVRHL